MRRPPIIVLKKLLKVLLQEGNCCTKDAK